MIYCRERAFTLVELVTTLAIATVTFTFALSSMQALTARSATRSALENIYTGFQLARSAAVNKQQLVTICPLDSRGSCSNNWDQPISVFLDPMNEKSLRAGNLLQLIPEVSTGTFSVAPANKRYFQFQPIGTAHGTLGNITFCPHNGGATHAGQLVLSMGGRMRFAIDRDSDGTVDASDGSPITCAST